MLVEYLVERHSQKAWVVLLGITPTTTTIATATTTTSSYATSATATTCAATSTGY